MKTIFQSSIILLFLVTGICLPLHAQEGSVGIGTTNPDPSAILDLVSSDKGLLIPRMTTQQMMSIENPPPGLMIFDTEKNALCAFSNETNWQILGLLPNGNHNDLLQLDENGKPYWAPFAGEANIDTLALGLGNALPEALVHIRDGNLRIDNGDIRSWGPINFLPDFDGSGDSRISFLASDYSTKAILDEYGNFGLGTDMPSNKLDILSYNLDQGSVAQISNSDKSQFIRMFSGHSNDPNNWINWKDGNALIFSTANNDYSNWQERMRIAEYGFVGIGETNPNAPLSIQRTVNATDPNYLQLLHNRSNTDGASAMIGFSVSAADIGFGNYTPAAIGFNRGKGLVFQVHSGSGNPPNRMEISNTGVVKVPGKVHIGEIYPSEDAILAVRSSTNAKIKLGDAFTSFDFVYSDPKLLINSVTSLGNATNRFSINKANGHIGIGTDNPLKTLHVNGGSMLVSANATANGNANITLSEDKLGSTGMSLQYDGTNDLFSINRIVGGSTATPNFTIDASGMTTVSRYNNTGNVMRIVNTSSYQDADGLEIRINSDTDYRNNFISFTNQSGVIGRIEGMKPGDYVSGGMGDFIKNLLSPPTNNLNFTFEIPLFASADQSHAVNENGQGDLNAAAANNSAISSAYAQFEQPNVNMEVVINAIIYGITVVKDAILVISSAASILDPEDIFAAVLNLIASTAQMALYIGFVSTTTGVAYMTGGADYAEWLERADMEEHLTAGDIVGVKSGKISKYFEEASHYMAISTAPAMAGNMQQEDKEGNFEMVGFMGQIPVKVRGKVEKGDYIIPSGNNDGLGIAVKKEEMRPRDFRRVVGIAWDESDGKAYFKLINTAVGINHNDLADVVDEMQMIMDKLQIAMKKLDPDFEMSLYGNQSPANKSFNNMEYSVDSTHSIHTSQYFADKTYGSHEGKIQLVKDALKDIAKVDLNEYPLASYLLDNTNNSEQLISYYSNILTQLQNLQRNANH